MSKYKNKKIIFDDIEFDSILEKDFYIHLLKKYKKEDIIVQPKFELLSKFTKKEQNYRSTYYVADFQIGNIVYDVKTFITATPVFKLKEKLFNYKYHNLTLICVNKSTKEMQSKGFEVFDEYKKIEKYKKDKKKELNNEKNNE